MNHITAVVAGLSLACAGTSTVWADELCIEPENMIDCSDNWFFTYNASTFQMENGCPIGAPRAELTHQHHAVWDKLVSFGTAPTMPILALPWQESKKAWPSLAHIENPVLVVTIDTSDWSDYLPFRCGSNSHPCDPANYGKWVFHGINVEDMAIIPTPLATPWFGAHMVESISENGTVTYHQGTALGYLDQILNVNREELNPTHGDPGAAVYAASLATPGVGMPWTFNQASSTDGHSHPDPWLGGGAAWWQQRYLVLIADRDAFVRPSFNPSMRAHVPGGLHTDNGKPWWDDEFLAECSSDYGSYNYPPENHALYQAFLEATENFWAVLDFNLQGDPIHIYQGTDGFLDYMAHWKQESWETPSWAPQDGSWDWTQSTQAVGFPFSGLGLTLNWTQFWPEAIESEGDLNNPFGATSEFIHATTDKPIYLVAILDPYQYLGESLAYQVPWCDTCIGDFNRDGVVDVLDLLLLLNNWGTDPYYDGADFPLQYNIDKWNDNINTDYAPAIDIFDLLELLNVWGPCEEWPLDWRPGDCPPPNNP